MVGECLSQIQRCVKKIFHKKFHLIDFSIEFNQLNLSFSAQYPCQNCLKLDNLSKILLFSYGKGDYSLIKKRAGESNTPRP